VALRYPRGSGRGLDLSQPFPPLEIGRAEVLREGDGRVALVGIGTMTQHAEAAADRLESAHGLRPAVVDARFVKPLDEALLARLGETCEYLFTIEDNSVAGGFGSAVNEMFERLGLPARAHPYGLPDRFVEHGSPEELYEELGLTPGRLAEDIARRVNGR